MILYSEKRFSYETENIIRLFFPNVVLEKNESSVIVDEESEYIYISVNQSSNIAIINIKVSVMNNCETFTEEIISPYDEKDIEITIATVLYDFLSKICGVKPKWGILTGVRPAKLFSKCIDMFGSTKKAEKYFSEVLKVSGDKISLAADTMKAEEKAISFSSPDSYSLYVSIPFCPTRCSYCSFVSHSVEKTAALVQPYTDLLVDELVSTANTAEKCGLRLKTIYFGGGTPTQLSAEQLDHVMTAIEHNFDLLDLVEYTVEAGRPDTVTKDKFDILKKHNVSRISINPQTMNDDVLNAIGRKHSCECTRQAFKLARECGFNNINMDLIAGLPTDTYNGFRASLDEVMALEPENITIHTLSMKRSSRLVVENSAEYKAQSDEVEKMLSYAGDNLYESGFYPYYMYRQSKMVGNMENVGWAKEGFECLYNIYMMNELHTVLSVGAGGVTRLKAPHSSKIERIFNFKYPYEYISRFDEIIDRKKGVIDFYEQCRI